MKESVSNRYSWNVVDEDGQVICPQCQEPTTLEDWMEEGEMIECMSCSSFFVLE